MSDLANALRTVGDLINDLGLVTTAAAVVVLLVTLFGAVFAFKVAGLLADTYTVKVADNAFRWLVDRIVAIGVVLSRPGPAGGDVIKEALAALDDYVMSERHSSVDVIGHALWYAWNSKETAIERQKITPPKVAGVASATKAADASAGGTNINRVIHDGISISHKMIVDNGGHDATDVEVTNSVGKSLRLFWDVQAPPDQALRVQPANLDITRAPDRQARREPPPE